MLTQEQILILIAKGENLTTEFKSDRNKLPDNDLISAVICLANSEGGYLLIGVEDDGEVTGLHKNHQDIQGLTSFIASRSSPSITPIIEKFIIDDLPIAIIHVPKVYGIVATSEGLIQRRRLKADGKPECVPFQPHEFIQRQSSFGVTDPSKMPILQVTADELDPLQRLRLRKAISRYSGDKNLANLDDEELDGALGLTVELNGIKHPTLTGLLLLGTETLLRQYVPAHEIAFQILSGTDVKANQFYKKPLLEAFEEVELNFNARIDEEEIQVGLFRVPVPTYDKRAFREAFVNALVHRDYFRLGFVQVKLEDTGLTISSAGGFVEGVNLNNLLTVHPRSRNPHLADVMQRIGLAERTGRGIDRIFEGMLRYGRVAPDYSMSDNTTVTLYLANSKADLDFLRMIIEQEERQNQAMPIDSLIILSKLREERRLTNAEIAPFVQKPETQVRASLEKLCESGLVEAHGTGRGRSYTLSLRVYQKKGEEIQYVRQVGFNDLQKQQLIINTTKAKGIIKRADVMELCFITAKQATSLLNQMVKQGILIKKGNYKSTYYILSSGT